MADGRFRRTVLRALAAGTTGAAVPVAAARGDDQGRDDRGDRGEDDPDDRGGENGRGCRGRGHDRGNGRNCDGGEGDDGDGDDPLRVSVERSDDGTAFTGGQTNRVDLAVEASRPVYVRDGVPEDWAVVGGDDCRERDGGVAFVDPIAGGTVTYLAEAPDDPAASGTAAFGPVAVSTDGERWETVDGTTATVVVVGQST